MKTNDVSSYFYYMWNAWSKEECEITFKNSPCNWTHFWEKWCSICDSYGVFGAAERFYLELSETNRDFLVARACQLYDRNRELN